MKSATDAAKMMVESQTEIMIAFMAKYGIQPNECILCYQGNKFWVESKEIRDKWISVKDKLPNDNQRVLALFADINAHILLWYANNQFNPIESDCYLQDWNHLTESVNYWMPLPEPPT
jgi:hypothetical protein